MSCTKNRQGDLFHRQNDKGFLTSFPYTNTLTMRIYSLKYLMKMSTLSNVCLHLYYLHVKPRCQTRLSSFWCLGHQEIISWRLFDAHLFWLNPIPTNRHFNSVLYFYWSRLCKQNVSIRALYIRLLILNRNKRISVGCQYNLL